MTHSSPAIDVMTGVSCLAFMKCKIGRNEFDITNEDIVFFNGRVYQVTTQKIFNGWHHYLPVMSETQFKKLLKRKALVLIKEELACVTRDGREMWYRYYRFDLEHLAQM